MSNENDSSQKDWDQSLQSCQPIEQFLELKNPSNDTDVESASLVPGVPKDSIKSLEKDDVREYDGEVLDRASLDQYFVPSSLIERWGSAMGILFLINWSQTHNIKTSP